MHDTILAPSILAGDHAALADSLKEVEAVETPWIHLDIMDGHFVPNLTFGPQTVADLRKDSKLFFDTHLMLDNPHEYVEAFAKAGSDLISIHVEPDYPIADTLKKIRELGCQNGIVLNPGTPITDIEPYLGSVDLVLIMTVQPGFGGQSFKEETLPKMQWVKQQRQERGLSFRLEVDGGVDLKTAPLCKEHGVDTLVAGSAFFKAEDKAAFLKTVTA